MLFFLFYLYLRKNSLLVKIQADKIQIASLVNFISHWFAKYFDFEVSRNEWSKSGKVKRPKKSFQMYKPNCFGFLKLLVCKRRFRCPAEQRFLTFFTFRNNGFVSKHTSKNNQLKALSNEIRTFRGSSFFIFGLCYV